MIHRWQRLAIAVAVSLTVCAGTATAQTVIVKGAPAGAQTELVLNGTAVASATADEEGLATMTVPQSAAITKQTEAHVFVDRCAEVWRVLLVEGALSPSAGVGACARQAITGYFIVRPVTTFVVDVSGSTSVLWLIQGRAPAAWLRPGTDPVSNSSALGLPPTGLVAFGGAGLALTSNLEEVACGTVTACEDDSTRLAWGGGIAYWFNPFVAFEAQYSAPGDATAQGADTNLAFTSSLETRLVTISGLFAAPAGRARVYGRAGVNRHRAVLNTTQAVGDTTVNVDGETRTIPGATQTLELRTAGWGYIFGGGVEVWLSRFVAIYGDGSYTRLNGKTEDASLRTIEDGVWLAQAGVRVRIGR